MARPKATELTARELAVMQVFWNSGQATAEDVHSALAAGGESIAYTTVANVVRQLADKGFLRQLNAERPFNYKPLRRFEDVSKKLVGDLMSRLFQGSRQAMLVQLFDRKKLTAEEKAFLLELLAKDENHD